MTTDNGGQSTSTTGRTRMRRILGRLGWLAAGAALAVLIVADPLDIHPLDSWFGAKPSTAPGAQPSPADQKQLWTCSMHPQVIQDHPGECPICGMDLVPLKTEPPQAEQQPAGSGERKVLFYRNPMNPTITSPVPMKDEMGMDYVPVYSDDVGAAGGERKILFYRNPMTPTITSPVPMKDEMGMDYVPVYSDDVEGAAKDGATVTIDPATVQNMNVQTAAVERRDVRREIRTVGYLDYDQERMVTVTTKYPGWVEKVYVNYVGEPVAQGQRLFQVYSPELVQTEQDLLTALAFADKMKSAPEGARQRAEALVTAARTRLGYWDISREQIERLESSREVFRTLTVTAPASGMVMKRMDGLEGMAVKPGMELFHIADLSSLWLSVEVFEDQLAWLKVGSTADVSLSYFPGETFAGRVRFIEPQVSEKTRTIPLRLEIPNKDGRLRPGMYATVRFQPVVAKNAVVVPALAVLRTGERNLVVVAQGAGRFAPREVALGGEGDGMVQVLSGLQEGETIVTSAQFLIDSESNLREAIQKMIAASQAK